MNKIVKCIICDKDIVVVTTSGRSQRRISKTNIDSSEGIFFCTNNLNFKERKNGTGGQWFCNECWDSISPKKHNIYDERLNYYYN